MVIYRKTRAILIKENADEVPVVVTMSFQVDKKIKLHLTLCH